MQDTKSFSVIIPLDRATDRRVCGAKTTAVARLHKLGFATPNAFCLSTDAYRTHLWCSRVRTLARCNPSASERAELRKWIMESDLPVDVITSLETAYRSLGRNATVAIRHSASDEEIAGKAYASVIGVRGFRALIEAIKVVWASLWSEEAAELRERTPDRAEPTMAVLVQIAVDARVSGVSVAADPTTGDPNEVHIRSTWGIFSDDSVVDRTAIDLADLSIIDASIAAKPSMLEIGSDGLETKPTPDEMVDLPSLSSAQAIELAEATVWVDTALGHKQIIHWAHDGEQIFILGAWPVGQLRPHFPVSWSIRNEGLFLWQILSSEPGPSLIQSLSVFHDKRVATLPSGKGQACIRSQNGRPYRRVTHPWEAKGWFAATHDMVAARRLLRRCRSTALRIEKSCKRDLSDPYQELSEQALRSQLQKALSRVETSMQWMESVAYPASRFSHLLRELLLKAGLPSTSLQRLLVGHDPVWMERDLALQRLAAFVWQASQDELVADAPEQLASIAAKEFGYVFEKASDFYDPRVWDSWVERPDRLLQIAEVLTRGFEKDADLAQSTARSIASAAEQEAFRAIRSSRGIVACKKLKVLLRRCRESLAAESRAAKVHALALTTLRLVVMELGRRLEEADCISCASDVFNLTPKELLQLHHKMTKAENASIRRTIAERKHKAWLQSRLDAPHWLPLGAGPKAEDASHNKQNRVLVGNPVGRGEAVGQVRIAKTLDEALQMQSGEILVVEEMAPAWTPLLCLASGLVMHKGSALSHGALTALNYGIPCVSEVAGVTSALQNGQLVRLDGTTGTVEILKRRSQNAPA